MLNEFSLHGGMFKKLLVQFFAIIKPLFFNSADPIISRLAVYMSGLGVSHTSS